MSRRAALDVDKQHGRDTRGHVGTRNTSLVRLISRAPPCLAIRRAISGGAEETSPTMDVEL